MAISNTAEARMGTSALWFKMTVTESSINVANNTSTVTCNFQIYNKTGSSGYTAATNNFSYNINGNTETIGVGRISASGTAIGTVFVSVDKTFTISHSGDGTKTISCSSSVTPSNGANASVSFSLTLSTIARASAVSVNATSVAAGKTITISCARKSTNFTNTLQYKVGSGSTVTLVDKQGIDSKAWTPGADLIPKAKSATITIYCTTYSGSTKIGDTQSTTFTLTGNASTISSVDAVTAGNNFNIKISKQKGNQYYHKITYSANSKSEVKTWDGNSQGTTESFTITGTGVDGTWVPSTATTATITVSCATYTDSSCSTQVGSTSSKTATITLPVSTLYKPTTPSIAIENYNASKQYGYVQGHCGLKFTYSATAGQGATMKNYDLIIKQGSTQLAKYENLTATTKDIGYAIKVSGSVTIEVIARDSRSRTTSRTTSINILAYTDPKIINASAIRYDSDAAEDNEFEGEDIHIIYDSQISSAIGSVANSISKFEASIKTVSGSDKGTFSLTGSSGELKTTTGNYLVSTAYIVTLSLTDKITTVTLNLEVPMCQFPIDIYANNANHLGLAFGKSASNVDLVDSAWNLKVAYTGTNKDYINSGVEIDRLGGIEIYHPTNPHIDFHYGNSKSDYTSRISEISSGNLVCSGNFVAKNVGNNATLLYTIPYESTTDSNYISYTLLNSAKFSNYRYIMVVGQFYANTYSTIIEPYSLFSAHNGSGNRIIIYYGTTAAIELYPSSNTAFLAKRNVAYHRVHVYGLN